MILIWVLLQKNFDANRKDRLLFRLTEEGFGRIDLVNLTELRKVFAALL